jgi:hypothetical protein
LSIKTDGKVSLTEVYSLPYNVRESFKKLYNKFIEEKNESMKA